MSLFIRHCIVSPVETNCYLIRDTETGKVAVIDPGEYNNNLVNLLNREQVTKLEYILLTHGHFDHIDGAKKLKENFGGKIVISKIDEMAFTDPELSLNYRNDMSIYPEKADITVENHDELKLGNSTFYVLSTPGHTAGSICYVFEKDIFSGDTLFLNECGRTDLKSGNFNSILKSLQVLAGLEGDYNVYPGHGPRTWLSMERQYNPYINRK